MKFVCVSDIHLKISRDAPLAWSLNRYRLLFKLIITECHEHNAWLLLGGDIMDNVLLKLDELNLLLEFFNMLEEFKVNTILISGNHESLGQSSIYDYLHLDTYGPRKGFSYIHYNDVPAVFDNDIIVYPVSHHELHTYDYSKVTKDMFSILLSHARCTIPPFLIEETPINEISKNFNVCIYGDIHDAHSPYPNVFYTNCPINSQFDTSPNTGFILLDVCNGSYSISRVRTDLPALVSVQTTTEDFAEAVSKLADRHFHKIIVTGQLSELKKLPNNLPNAKILKVADQDITYQTEDEPEANLEQACTLEEELVRHMLSLDYNDSLIKNMVKELRDL